MPVPFALEADGLSKSFPGVKALDNLSLGLLPGEIHALMGENGAGKSTLINLLTGVYPPDSGRILVGDAPVSPGSPSEAEALGIGAVYQEISLLPTLSVAENLTIGRPEGGFLGLGKRAMRQRASEALARLGLTLDLDRPLGELPMAAQQMVAICRALGRSGKVLILDEPTSSLDKAETERLFGLLRSLAQQGTAILFVTHFIGQVYEISHRITVMRGGRLVEQKPTAELERAELVAAMMGKSIAEVERLGMREPADSTSGDLLYRAKGLGKRGRVAPVDLELRRGEVVALAGLLGSGRSETVRLIFGAEAPDSGEVWVDGERRALASPRAAIAAGMGYCSEDRKADGIVPNMSVRENILLTLQAKRGWLKVLSKSRQRDLLAKLTARLHLAESALERPIGTLSGGNQQKALLARWIASEPDILLLDEPTRGIDVGAKDEIMRLIRDLVSGGMAALFVSSELEETLQMADRVAIFVDRSKVGELGPGEISDAAIMARIAGAEGPQ